MNLRRFDLIDGAGRLTRRVLLPPQARLVGFGAGTLYLVRVGDGDLEYLERHEVARRAGAGSHDRGRYRDGNR
jgi:hypothetical protein